MITSVNKASLQYPAEQEKTDLPQEVESTPKSHEGNQYSILLRFVLLSLLLHGIVLGTSSMNWHPVASPPRNKAPMTVRLPLSNQEMAKAPSSIRHTENEHIAQEKGQEATPKAGLPAVDDAQKHLDADETADPDEGYLRREYLSLPAIPEDEINLSDIQTPGMQGTFRIQVWINSRGQVTGIYLDETELPSWFTDQIIDRFAKSAFTPAQRNERTVASIMRIEVDFY